MRQEDLGRGRRKAEKNLMRRYIGLIWQDRLCDSIRDTIILPVAPKASRELTAAIEEQYWSIAGRVYC